MGMSASQARFLCLTARKSNVEFEGQQINQQRTTLSNESASYYSALCDMAVPVPPSIDDYTRVTYTFDDGATSNTVTSLLYSSADKKYHVNYIQQWQDDYSIVPNSSALVLKSGEGDAATYSVGGVTLRTMDGNHADWKATDTFPSYIEDDPYYKSLGGDKEQIAAALNTEKYYVALLKEQGLGDDFYVRYVKNTTTGHYDPVFYEADKLENTPYNDRSLASVPCYGIGSTTKSKEILNVACDIEQDASGRYVSLIFQDPPIIKTHYGITGTTTTTGTRKHTQEEIEAWVAQNPVPVLESSAYYVPGVDNSHWDYESGPIGYEKNYTLDQNDTLASDFIYYSDGCLQSALLPDITCYTHVLNHILALPDPNVIEYYTDEFNSYYPVTFNTTSSKEFSIPYNTVTQSTIYYNKFSDDLYSIHKAVEEGYDFGNGIETLYATSDLSKYEDIATYMNINTIHGDIEYDIIEMYPNGLQDYLTSNDGVLGYAKLLDGTAQERDILLSNFYIDNTDNQIKTKTIKQKAIDLRYAISHQGTLGIAIEEMVPLILTFQYDLMRYNANVSNGEPIYTWVSDITESSYDEEQWQRDKEAWEARKQEFENEDVETSETINTYGDITETIASDPKRIPLLAKTTTDEDAYNNAMNDYYYKQHEYDHKIQEINSKLEILQQQDKQLELKLKQLDTEENAISTELDAVKKVISKNIDSSFKTFNA